MSDLVITIGDLVALKLLREEEIDRLMDDCPLACNDSSECPVCCDATEYIYN